MHNTRKYLVLAVLIALLLSVATAYGLPLLQIPAIPHSLDGREDCLLCHDEGQIKPYPEDHTGRPKDTCTGCHQVESSGGASPIPHDINGITDCLQCHDIGQVKPFPGDHQGRANESCLSCHGMAPVEPTKVPEVMPLPTPIREPEFFGENTCISCHLELGGSHEQITADWTDSVHASRGVGCVSCHGGDPTQADAAASMSPDAGFLGPLPKDQIPGLCGSCHSQIELMRSFDLPTDQFDQYWQSQHGQALLEGDTNVATCFDCHDGHRVLKVTDPASKVYPSNEPQMCAECHVDETLMAPYGIPTNQFSLYEKSVHGTALLENQNLRAPTCSTCHGAHGAAPPGFQAVSNVCGQCHSTTEDYYLQGVHRSGMSMEAAPRCVTCHGRYDVMPATRELFVGTEERHCGSCHEPGSSTAEKVDAMYKALTEADDAFEKAEATIALATENRLIMAGQEEMLGKAHTPLIESRAMQHTAILEDIETKATESMELSQAAQASAEAALEQLDTRKVGMAVALGIILITIIALVLIKTALDKDLEAERAQRRSKPEPVK